MAMEKILDLIQQFEPISLNEMNAVQLLNRFDSKYPLSEKQLLAILEAVKYDYFIMEINGEMLQTYKTTYFDTIDNSSYIAHHNGKLNRLKIRKREYVNSGIGFLEIKKKNNKGKTNKLRFPTDNLQADFTLKELEFLNQNTSFNFRLSNCSLPGKNGNSFRRITLVNKDFSERCTIDLCLSFFSVSKQIRVENMAIIELKQGKVNMKSPLFNALRNNRIRRQGFSKYCMGRALLEPELKQNLFKGRLLKLKKQYNEQIRYEILAGNLISIKDNNETVNRYNNKRTA